jgi:hypothetical protein
VTVKATCLHEGAHANVMIIGAASEAAVTTNDLRGLSWGQVGGSFPVGGRLILYMLCGRAGLGAAGRVGAWLEGAALRRMGDVSRLTRVSISRVARSHPLSWRTHILCICLGTRRGKNRGKCRSLV